MNRLFWPSQNDKLKPACFKGSSRLKILLFFFAFVILYHDVLMHMLKKSLSSENFHWPFIIGVSLYLIWIKRRDIKNISSAPGLLPGSILAGFGCFMLFAGRLGGTMLVQQFSVIPVLLGSIWLFLGLNHFKIFLLPISYLIFLMGVIEVFLESIVIYLQNISAYIGFHILSFIGYPVLLTSQIIELPHITMEVARGCSGIEHIVSLLAFTVALSYFSQKNLAGRCVLIFSAIFIAIFINGVRIALIGIYAKYWHGADIHGPFESLYASFIFYAGLILVVILSHFLRKVKLQKNLNALSDTPTSWTCSKYEPIASEIKEKKYEAGKSKSLGPAIPGISIFAVTFFLIHFYLPGPVYLKNSFQAFPVLIDNFRGRNIEQIDEHIRPFSADEELLRVYEDADGNSVEVYVGYFAIQSRNRKMIDHRRNWMHEEIQTMPIAQEFKVLTINKTRLPDGTNPAHVYFWYFIDGRIITNPVAGKFITFWDGLVKRKNNAAVVVIKIKNENFEVSPLLSELFFTINNHLSGI
jgi:EpsI family protein